MKGGEEEAQVIESLIKHKLMMKKQDDYEYIQPPCWLGQQLLGTLFASLFGFAWRLACCRHDGFILCSVPGLAFGTSMGVTAAVTSTDDRLPTLKILGLLFFVSSIGAGMGLSFTQGLDDDMSLLVSAILGTAVATLTFSIFNNRQIFVEDNEKEPI
mmetsp:Transcript_38733/g.51043  ORF Transcript_38733/g.51043 Transcript_38733/m.51043 type:complete len:157 (+) Transcript_38733:46-516(+)